MPNLLTIPMNEIEFLILKSCAVAILARIGFGPRRPESAHPTDPPEPGLGYLCLLLVELEKKVSLSGTAVDRADRPVGWSRQVAGTIFYLLVLCIRIRAFKCVNVSPAWPPRSGLFGLFRLENPARQRAPPPSCSVVLDTKNVLKKICAPERTVDQKRADNPGSERTGVRLFLRSEPRVSFELSYLS